MWNEDFSFKFYGDLLQTICDGFTSYYASSGPSLLDDSLGYSSDSVILRHDVDLFIKGCMKMGRLELDYSVPATYHVMTQNPFYDINKHKRTLFKLMDMGHEIGLHFNHSITDTASPVSLESYINMIDEQCKELERVIEEPVLSLSFHRMIHPFMKEFTMIGNRVNATSRALTQRYISDSMGRWREGNPIDWLLKNLCQEGPIQILTHPIWWGGSLDNHVILELFGKKRLNDYKAKIIKDIFDITDVKVSW